MNSMNVASLFSGCGGMDLGFEGGIAVPIESASGLNIDQQKQIKNKFIVLPQLPFETIFACDVNIKAKKSW